MIEGTYCTLSYLPGSFSIWGINSVVWDAFSLHNPDPAPFESYCYFSGVT